MAKLSPDQRNHLYLIEAARVGIHKPILAALYAAHSQPSLADGETGLGISPANQIPLDRVNTLSQQIQYAANTIRSLSESLTAQGWTASDLWQAEKSCYSDRFLKTVAAGYGAPSSDTAAARLEACDPQVLLQAYLENFKADCAECEEFPQNLAYLDQALLTLVGQIPRYYVGIPSQREALVEATRIWNGWDTPEMAIAKLSPSSDSLDESHLDRELLQFANEISSKYTSYPHQREALLRLTQLWRQLPGRETAVASLKKNTSPETLLEILDPALIAFVHRLPGEYRGQAHQRNAIAETVRIWRQMESRTAVLISLGINAETLEAGKTDPAILVNAATGFDRELLEFIRRIPIDYKQLDLQREALIALVQLWRQLTTKDQTIKSLFDDLKQMHLARKGTPEAPPVPLAILPKRPEQWTTENIQMYASIIPEGNFTWAEATKGGTQMPSDLATVDAIIRIATLVQRARDRLGRPFYITNWYLSPEASSLCFGVSNSRHIIGDAIEFYCDGLSGDRVYWFLDPWWPGGLGRYGRFPYLNYIDARSYRSRWVN